VIVVVVLGVLVRMRVPAMTVVANGVVMWSRLVMKAEEVHAEVVAVRCVDNSVGVKFLGLWIF